MEDSAILKNVIDNGVFAVIRMSDSKKLFKVVEAIAQGGVKNIEITTTVTNAINVIKELKTSFSKDILVGAGTVLNVDTTKAVLDVGGQFVVCPILNLEVISYCKQNNLLIMPGCFSPTEIFSAYLAGADIIKVFPATALGPKYFKDILAPFPYLKLMPTGGVSIQNVGDWINAGATTVAIGSDLLDKQAIDTEQYNILTEKAKLLMSNFNNAKNKLKERI
jgi:2-dehydro-3-deoxyphosphogluconate aldolase/(4S)-4-hydroxy-2-oxoglutarate aldolase